MSYQNYVLAAYATFVVVMLWEWLSPLLQIRRQWRAVRLRMTRDAATAARHPPARRERE